MEFGAKRTRKRGGGRVKTEYPTNLQLYKVPPVETISLQEFEELAEQRHKRKWQIDSLTALIANFYNLPPLKFSRLRHLSGRKFSMVHT